MNTPAKWWREVEKDKILCCLCPRLCKLGKGQIGYCSVRQNIGGELYLLTHSQVAGLHVDPIEKKPLYHFLPGTQVLSFGTAGCNLGCKFCQNCDMSTAKVDEIFSTKASPEQIVDLALRYNSPSLAYTYNEPSIYGEFVIDVSEVARRNGIRNVMVSNGYISPEARGEVYKSIGAVNIDLKGFNKEFYWKYTISHLVDVLDTIKWVANETDVWLEITNLLIPGLNDDVEEVEGLVDWILDNCGNHIPLHFSAFHPAYKLIDRPRTPDSTLKNARKIALDKGMKYVYIGNAAIEGGSATFCPKCGKKLIDRTWFSAKIMNMKDGHCVCGEKIDGVFE